MSQSEDDDLKLGNDDWNDRYKYERDNKKQKIDYQDQLSFTASTRLEAADPILTLNKSTVAIENEEIAGYLIALKFDYPALISYEIYGFIEENLQVEVADLSIFRDFENDPTGIVIARLSEIISISHVKSLEKIQFKGKDVHVRLFRSFSEIIKFVKGECQKKISSTYLPLHSNIPLVYVSNFGGSKDDLYEICKQYGQVIKIDAFDIYYVVYFFTEQSAKTIFQYLNTSIIGSNEVYFNLLYKNTASRAFGIRFSQDNDLVIKHIKLFGNIESTKFDGNGTLYILMSSVIDSKVACLLMNSRPFGGSRIQTFFISYFEYESILT